MSSDEQATAYIKEAELTLESTKAIYLTANETQQQLWAQVVKNGYDAIEQSISAALAVADEPIPRRHPAKINAFIDLIEPSSELEETLLYWLQRRSSSQYVDIRGDEVNIPHEQFDQNDAERILKDADRVLEFIREHDEIG